MKTFGIGGSAEPSGFEAMLKLLSDPATMQARLKEFRQAEADAQNAAREANAEIVKATAMKAESEAILESAKATRRQSEAALEAANELQKRLDIKQGTIEQRDKEITARERVLPARVAALEQREAAVAEREKAVEAAARETAATKADYESKLAALKKAVGAGS